MPLSLFWKTVYIQCYAIYNAAYKMTLSMLYVLEICLEIFPHYW